MKLHLPLALRYAILALFSFVGITTTANAEKICGNLKDEDGPPMMQVLEEISGYSRLVVCHCDELVFTVSNSIHDIDYIYVYNNDKVSAITGNAWVDIYDCDRVVFRNNVSSELYTSDVTGVKALAGGGAITGYCDFYDIDYLSFDNNQATEGVGGAIDSDGGTVRIQNCGEVSFNENYAKIGGGAIGLYGHSKGWFGRHDHYLHITNCEDFVTFSDNQAGENGGAIHAKYAYINNNKGPVTFSGNKAGEYGGAIYLDSYTGYDSEPWRTLYLHDNRDVIFQDNSATEGGALYLLSKMGTAYITNNDSVVFKDNLGGAIYSNSHVQIQGNDEVLFIGNGVGIEASSISLSTTAESDSSISIYDSIKTKDYLYLNTLTPEYNVEGGTANGVIRFSGTQSCNTVARSVQQGAGTVLIENGASLKVGGDFELNGGNLIVEHQLQQQMPVEIAGRMLVTDSSAKITFNLDSGITADKPLISVGGKLSMKNGCFVLETSSTEPQPMDVALLFVAGSLECDGKTYTYENDEWTTSSGGTRVSLKPEDLLFDSLTWDDSYTLHWEDRTLFYSYLNLSEAHYKAKGYDSETVWWGNDTLSWYDVDKQKELNSGSSNSSAGINQDGNQNRDLSCWIAVACNMIQYWQDKYAPLYPGSGLITPTKKESNYRVLYDTLRSTAVVEGADKGGSALQMLSLWFANPITDTTNPITSTIQFTKDKGTAWRELGFTDGKVYELFNYEEFRKDAFNNINSPSEKNEKLKEEVQGVFNAWWNKAYSPIALSFGDGKSIGHEVTVWDVVVKGDDLTLIYTDSDYMENSPSTMKAKFIDGEFIITEYQTNNNQSIKADEKSHMMPQTLAGTKVDTKWTMKWLAYISTPDGVDEMLADYYSDNEYYWTGKRISIKQIGDQLWSIPNILELDKPESNSLADETAGWKKNCNSKNNKQHVWANTYLTDSKSKLIFGNNVGNDVVKNKSIRLTTSFNVSEMNVCGLNYYIYNSESDSVTLTLNRLSVSGTLSLSGKMELKAETLDVTGTLGVGGVRGVEDNVKISATNINIKGTLDLCGNTSSTIPVLDGCKKINMDGGVLECITLIVKKEDSVNSNLQEDQTSNVTSKYSIAGANIQMKNCTINETVNENKWGTIRYNICSDHDIHLNESDVKSWEKVVFDYLIKSGNNLGVADNYNYAPQISEARVLANVAFVKSSQLGLSGGTLEVQSDAETTAVLTLGNGNSSADILISESEGGTVLAAVSPLMTLPGETVYLADSAVIEAPELTVSEDSTLENHGSLADVDSLVVEYDGVLSGNGVFGGTTVYEGGRVMVGGSPGAPVYDSLSMLSGSELVFCLDGSKPASAAENGWGSGTHSLLTVTQADGLTLESGTAVLVGCSLDFLNSVTVGDTQTLTLVQLGSAADAALLAALQSGTEFKLANADDSLEALSSVGALVHSTSWAQGGNNTLTLSFIVSSCPENALVWTDASGNGTWDSASQNWAQQDGTAALFSADRNVLITRGGSINLAEILSAGDVVVSSRDNLVLAGSGSLGGDGSLVKEGRGELSITTANTYSGGTYVNGGKLKVLHAEALGLGGVLLQGGELEIGVNGVDNALVNNAVSRLTIAPGVSYALPTEIYNSGELTISGTLNADALTDAADFAATRLDAAGNEGAHGFVRDAGSKVVVVSGAGTLDAAAATVTRDGKDYVLGSDGIAVHGMEVHGGSYLAGSGHSVKLSEVVTAAATHGASATDVLLSGGSLTADRALTGTLSASGTSSLVAENWVVSSSFTNAGTLSISGSIVADGMTTESIAATRVDVNGNTGAYGFVKNAGSRFTLVDLQNGGSLDIGALSITRNGTDYLLGNDGVALAEGSVECSAYLIGPGHEVKLSRVVTAAATHGASATDVLLSGGSLTADRALTGTLTASGTSSLVAENWAVNNSFTNEGNLSIRGSIVADGIDCELISATHVDVNGNTGEHGFAKDAGSKFTLVQLQHGGSLDIGPLSISRDGTEYTLQADGTAHAGEATHYGRYTIGTGHEVRLSQVAAAAGNHGEDSTHIDLAGGTLIADRALTGQLKCIGNSTLKAENWAVSGSFTNEGTLRISGSIVADGMTAESIAATHVDVNGNTGAHGFTRDAGSKFTLVQLQQGGSLDIGSLSITRDGTEYTLHADGTAHAGETTHYGRYTIGTGHEVRLSQVAAAAGNHGEASTNIDLAGGTLIADRALTGQLKCIGNSSLKAENWAVSGSFTNEGTLSISGSIVADGMTAESIAATHVDVDGNTGANGFSRDAGSRFTLVQLQNGGSLEVGELTLSRQGMNYTLGADGAAVAEGRVHYNHYLAGNGHRAAVSDIVRVAAWHGVNCTDIHLQGGTLAADAPITGALTLGGGSIELDGRLTVQGDVTFESGTQTTLDLSGWKGLDDGEVLADLGSSNSGYADGCLTLEGVAGDWELAFDSATGVLTLVAVKDEPLPEPEPEPIPEPEFKPELNPNQQIVFDTVKDIMGEGTPGGLLGELGKEVTGTRDEEKLKQLLDEMGGAEYATLMSGQQAAASGHMRRLRGEMGSGHQLAGTKTRAYIEAYNHRSELDGDASGRGYELSESGGQFALEFIGEGHTSGGFAVAAGRSKLQPDGGLTQKSDNTYVDAFVLHRDGSYTGKFSLGVGVHKYDLERRVAGNPVEADTDGSSVNFMHESAWAVSLAESHSVQVFGAVESSFNKLGAFHEKGADTASLQVESQDAWVTTLSVGARYLYSFDAVNSAPAATLSVQGGLEVDFGDTESEVEMSFEGARGHSFRQSGAERDTFGYNLGASLHLPVSTKAAIYASGDAVLRGNSYEVNANVGLQMAF